MILVNGKNIAQEKFLKIEKEFKEKAPSLGVLQVGENKVSDIYIDIKKKEFQKRGALVSVYNLEENISTEEVVAKIKSLKEDGVMVQLPLPENLDREKILSAIPEEKDVDVLSYKACGMFYKGIGKIIPPVVGAVSSILAENNISVKGKVVVVVGAGNLVGKPLSVFFVREGATVITTNIHTANLKYFTENADIVVSGTGVPGLIKGDMISKDSVVIDAGTSSMSGKVKGDVDKDGLKMKTGLLSPVPGGVGPLTVYFLAENLLKLKKNEY